MAAEMTEDPEDTLAATTEGEDTVDESTATEAMEAGGTATGTQTTPETEGTTQATENPEAGGTPGGRLETGRMEWGTTAATAGAPTTVPGRPRQSRQQRGARRTDKWSPGTRSETTFPLQLARQHTAATRLLSSTSDLLAL